MAGAPGRPDERTQRARFVKTFGAAVYCIVVTVGFIAMCALLYLREIPASQKDIALVLLGALIASFKDVGSFFTGSTMSSQAKHAIIGDIASNKAPPPGTPPTP